MGDTIGCPACNAPINLNQLFWTGTLLRFKCPHCATRLQPTDTTFAASSWVITVVVGVLAGVAVVTISGLTRDAVGRVLAYMGLVILVAGAVAVIKWHASQALIKKGELKVAK